MASLFDNDFMTYIIDTFTGGLASTNKATKKIEQAGKEYEQKLSDIAKNTKGAKELYREGKEAAAAMANDKAGIAQRQAKAAAMQNSGSRLMSAIQGAQAASDATRQGYDEAASNAAALGAQAQAQKNAMLAQGAQGAYQGALEGAGMSAKQAQERAANTGRNLTTLSSSFINTLGE